MTLTNSLADDTAEAAADAAHPALSNVRADATAVQNRIDFNDPHKSGAEAVADALNIQGLATKNASGA